MEAGEESTPVKLPKCTPTTQETLATPYPDWSSPMQAYYGAGATPPQIFTSPASPHPYLWGSQVISFIIRLFRVVHILTMRSDHSMHTLITPYGTPVPYPALYPPRGVYAHPNMAMTPNTAHVSIKVEGKASDGKDLTLMEKSKNSSANAGGNKIGEGGKVTSGSGNDGVSESAESGSDDSSNGSDENTNQQESTATKKRSFDQMLADGANAQNNTGGAMFQASFPEKSSMPETNLNIGMDLWNASPASIEAVKMRPNPLGMSSAAVPGAVVGREGVVPDPQWIQDERELKRQKRKQSNRESARRSRLRKQAECEELQVRVETLSHENSSLREEVRRLSEECEKLTSENSSIKEELTRIRGGSDAVTKLKDNNAAKT